MVGAKRIARQEWLDAAGAAGTELSQSLLTHESERQRVAVQERFVAGGLAKVSVSVV